MEVKNNKLATITIGIIGIVWCIGIITLSVMHNPPYKFGGALIFGIISIAFSVIYMLLFWSTPGNQSVETSAVSIYCTFVYLIVDIIVNTIFVLTQCGDFNKYLIIFNIVIIAAYAIVILYAETYSRRVTGQLELTNQKTYNTAIISEKIGILVNLTDDNEIKGKFLNLKETVDYSSNISSEKTYQNEKLMEDCLDEIKNLIINNSDKALIKNKIREAEITWKTRTSIASSRR
jgi:hypothetical protein